VKIDMYAHILTPKYREAVLKRLPGGIFGEAAALFDLEQRFRITDKYDEYVQVLSFSVPAIEAVADARDGVMLAKLGNDELAEIVAKHPDRFVAGVANLPMNNIDEALKEADRAINGLGLKGVLIYTNIDGKPLDRPEFMPLYEMMARFDLPIWIHPRRDRSMPDYATESESKYRLFGALGWPYETQLAMARLVCSGVLEKHPTLKFITHHCGAAIPFFGNRLAAWFRDFSKIEPGVLSKPPDQYFRMFYGDTALNGSTAALMCGFAFFGADHIVFATDMPYGGKQGDLPIKETIRAVNEMSISDADKDKIFGDNAKELLHLSI
jgi:aminocarboxymuconate-semialdehyde decarboxylase